MLTDILQNIKSAIHSGRTDIVRSLIEVTESYDTYGYSNEGITTNQLINSDLVDEGTFLHLATSLNQADIVRMLLAAGADPGIQNGKGLTAIELSKTPSMHAVYTEELLKATAQSNIGRVCQLLAAGISINATDSPQAGNTALHWAAAYANKDMVQCLLDRGASVNTGNKDGATPLHDAVTRGQLDIVAILLKNNANPMIRGVNGKLVNKSPIDLAENNPDVLELLTKHLSSVMNGDALPADGELTNDKKSNSLESLLSNVQENGIASITRRLSLLSGTAKDHGDEHFNPGVHHLPPHVVDTPSRASESISSANNVLNSAFHLLWPQPQQIQQFDGTDFSLTEEINVYIINGPDQSLTNEIVQMWRWCDENGNFDSNKHVIQAVLSSKSSNLTAGGSGSGSAGDSPAATAGDDCSINSDVTCHVNPHLFSSRNSYRLSVLSDRISIIASDLTGLHYAVTTYVQLLQLFSNEKKVPQVKIHDWPGFVHRGILLDISPQSRVPNMEALLSTIRILSTLKVSHIHLYTRFSSEDSWHVSFTHREILELSHDCQKLHVDLVPAIDVDHTVTSADVAELTLPAQSFLSCFPNSSFVHIGPHLTRLLIDTDSGEPPLDKVHKTLPVPAHVTLMICCNTFHSEMELLKSLPPNVILLEYGFQASYNFSDICLNFGNVGSSFCVVPGTARWNSITGCSEAAQSNIEEAARTAITQNALGIVTADWCGTGLIPANVFSWPGLVMAAGYSWNTDSRDNVTGLLAQLLDNHVFQDKSGTVGQVVLDLSQGETFLLRSSRAQDPGDVTDLPANDGSTLYQLLNHPDNLSLEHLTVDLFHQTLRHIKHCQTSVTKSEMRCRQADVILAEVQLAFDFIVFACKLGRSLVTVGQNPNATMGVAVVNMGVSNLVPTTRTDFANRLLGLIEQYRDIWLKRNLDNVGLRNVLECLNSIVKQMIPENS